MRQLGLPLLLVLLTPVWLGAGCKSTFIARTADLEAARALPPEGTALRVDDDGMTTYVDMRYYRGLRDNDGQHATVIVKDVRNGLRYTGIPLLALGVGLTVLGVTVVADADGGLSDLGDAIGGMYAIAFGALGIAGGLTLTIIGFVKTRPEVHPDEPGYRFVGDDGTPVQAGGDFWGVGATGRF